MDLSDALSPDRTGAPTIQCDANSVPWLEPKHVNLLDLANDIDQCGLDGVTTKYALSLAEWRKVAQEIASLYGRGAISSSCDVIINAWVNTTLAPHALSFPVYGTSLELKDVQQRMRQTPPDIAGAQKVIFEAVLNPRMRALQLVGRFMRLQPFKEFGYLIDAGALAFYRGNIPASYMTIVPVIEGILLRWMGYPDHTNPSRRKPEFKDLRAFVGDIGTREPRPLLPLFFDSWEKTVHSIVDDHLYKHTQAGPSADDFNRHLALHLLQDRRFCTTENVTRAFLLIDTLSELYICEKRLADPRWSVSNDEAGTHTQAYSDALASQKATPYPESVLFATHEKCR